MMPYMFTVYPTPEGGFLAAVLDLPGCYAQGETLEELWENIQEAVETWLWSHGAAPEPSHWKAEREEP